MPFLKKILDMAAHVFAKQPKTDGKRVQLAAILPISDRVRERLNIERAYLLLSSLDYFWRDAAPLNIHVIMPDDEQDNIEALLKRFSESKHIRLHFRNESQISKHISTAPAGYGIAKHMLIKLAANQFVNSDFYLVLDSDIVVCKPITTADLIISGKALTDYWPSSATDWWVGSEKVLHYPVGGHNIGRNRMFVTPQILSCEITSRLQSYLSDLFGGDWIRGLIDRFNPNSTEFWTEYTLYDLYAVHEGIFYDYHLPEEHPGARLHCMQQSLWVADNLKDWNPPAAFDGSSIGYFLVLQSIMAHDIEFTAMRRRVIDGARLTYSDFPDVSP